MEVSGLVCIGFEDFVLIMNLMVLDLLPLFKAVVTSYDYGSQIVPPRSSSVKFPGRSFKVNG